MNSQEAAVALQIHYYISTFTEEELDFLRLCLKKIVSNHYILNNYVQNISLFQNGGETMDNQINIFHSLMQEKYVLANSIIEKLSSMNSAWIKNIECLLSVLIHLTHF